MRFEGKVYCKPGTGLEFFTKTLGARAVSKFNTLQILNKNVNRCHDLVPLPDQSGPALPKQAHPYFCSKSYKCPHKVG